jgi:hypothetical protein
MTISINPHSSPLVTPQDLVGNSNSQTAASPTVASQNGGPLAGDQSETSPPVSDQITAHAGLVALAQGGAQGGVGGLVNPDLDGEGARLQALQLQQSLGAHTASIANQAPQALLALLR